MKRLTLKSGETKRFPIGSSKWLIVRESQEYLYIRSDNGDRIRVDSGDNLDVSTFKELEVSNPHTTVINAVFQLAKQQIITTPAAKVNFDGGVAVSEIRSTVTTRAEVAQRVISRAHVHIQPNDKARLFTASAVRVEAIIQNISDTETEAMLGDKDVSAVAGLPVLGDRQSPAGMTITGGGELWAYNNSNTVLRVALLEVHR